MSKRILVVEDQPDNRQIIRDMLAPTDYEITEAAAMIMFRNHSAHVSSWRKSDNICPKKPANYPGHRSREATNP
jgi:hypothetical protein